LIEKRGLLMSFYGWSEDYIRRMNGAKGWVWYAYARENQASFWGNDLVRAEGYKSFPEQEFEMVKAQKKVKCRIQK
jgi:hypothetical protein